MQEINVRVQWTVFTTNQSGNVDIGIVPYAGDGNYCPQFVGGRNIPPGDIIITKYLAGFLRAGDATDFRHLRSKHLRFGVRLNERGVQEVVTVGHICENNRWLDLGELDRRRRGSSTEQAAVEQLQKAVELCGSLPVGDTLFVVVLSAIQAMLKELKTTKDDVYPLTSQRYQRLYDRCMQSLLAAAVNVAREFVDQMP